MTQTGKIPPKPSRLAAVGRIDPTRILQKPPLSRHWLKATAAMCIGILVGIAVAIGTISVESQIELSQAHQMSITLRNRLLDRYSQGKPVPDTLWSGYFEATKALEIGDSAKANRLLSLLSYQMGISSRDPTP